MSTAIRPEPFADAIFRQLIASLPRADNERPAWHVAEPYLVRHAAQHAASAGLADELLQDPGFLVHADPETVTAALRQATTPDARLSAAVYRASQTIHRDLDADQRRQVLALDAARFQAVDLSYDFARGTDWRPLWATGTQVSSALTATLTGHTGRVYAVATAVVDGRLVAVTTDTDAGTINAPRVSNSVVRVWDLATGRATHTLTGQNGRVFAVATAVVNGRPVAITGSDDRTVRVWDLATGQNTHTLAGHTGTVIAVATAEVDGRPVAVTSAENYAGTINYTYDRTVRVWDLATGQNTHTLAGHTYRVFAVATAVVDGRPVAVTSGDDRLDARLYSADSVRVWDLATGQNIRTLTVQNGRATALATAEVDGRPIAITGGSGGDHTVRMWDLATGQNTHTIAGHTQSVDKVATAVVDGRPVAVTGANSEPTVWVWDLATGHATAALLRHTGGVDAVATTVMDGRPVALTSDSSSRSGHIVRVWDLATGQATHGLTGHTGTVTAVATTVMGGQPVAVTGGGDHTVRVWDLATGQNTHTVTGHIGRVFAVATAVVDGRPVAVTCGELDTAWVWDLATGQNTHTLTGHTAGVREVATAVVDGRPVAVTGGYDRTVRVWDLATGQNTHTLTGHTGGVEEVATAVVDGRPVAVTCCGQGAGAFLGPADRTVRVWDLATSQNTHTLTGHTNLVGAMATAVVDGRLVAITGDRDSDYMVRVWDLATGQNTHTLSGHTAGVREVATAVVDGRPVAVTCGDDRTVRVWDLARGLCLTTLTLPHALLRAVITADGTVALGMGSEVIVLTLESVLRRHR